MMKIKLGQSEWLTLDRPQLEKRFTECARYSTLLSEVRCGLDQAAHAFSAAGTGKAAAIKGLNQAGRAAAEIKRKVWVPDDRTAYAVEKSASDLSKRIAKGKADPTATKKALASVRAIEAKAKAMEEVRKGKVCGVHSYEGVKIEQKY